MKFKVGDKVLVTSGKNKGHQGQVTAVIADRHQVVVEGANEYTRHIKPMFGQPGQQVRRSRPLSTAKVAILNDKGQPDRIGYKIAKDGTKQRIYKKTGAAIDTKSKSKPAKSESSTSKKTK